MMEIPNQQLIHLLLSGGKVNEKEQALLTVLNRIKDCDSTGDCSFYINLLCREIIAAKLNLALT